MDQLEGDSSLRLRAWKVLVKRGEGPAFVKKLLEQNTGKGLGVLVVKADKVFGLDHLRSALYHAARAVEEGRNSSPSPPMEVMLYASGERQLGSAIDKMSVDEETEEIVVASLDGTELQGEDEWQVLDNEPRQVDAERTLLEFGIGKEELETVDADRRKELALEKTAMVDVLKK